MRSRRTKPRTRHVGGRVRPHVPSKDVIVPSEVEVYAAPTTTSSPVTDLSDLVAGFVAAEGYFGHRPGGRAFVFAVQLGSNDERSCGLLREAFGVGTVRRYERRKEHYQDEVHFTVRRLRDLVEVIVPFMDEHLPVSLKRRQYLVWRAELLRYWEEDSRRVRPCVRSGCEEPRRAKGLCRHHYYATYGR